VVVINPLRETGLVNFSVPSDVRSLFFGSEIASDYIQPHIGGDIAVLTGIAKVVLERGAIDSGFIARATDDWEAFKTSVENATWEEIEAKGGVSRSEIEQIAERYIKAENVVFSWTMGITHHVHGVENVRAIVNLALMRGMRRAQHRLLDGATSKVGTEQHFTACGIIVGMVERRFKMIRQSLPGILRKTTR